MRAGDIAVYDRDGRLALVVEVKGGVGRSPEWAARTYALLAEHDLLPPVPYFLLALPDRFYLWRGTDQKVGERLPDFAADATPQLGPYLERSGISAASIPGASLELLVSAWLWSVLQSTSEREAPPPGLEWLVQSGVWEAIQDGRVAYLEAAA